ncbi:glycosyltransferase family 39 protein [Actinokineospora auranticolor]|uniref:4-amino-4-deoxy-L-arabinose transferase-like glycosyltransferase n=1 Tax=Actinokineospora auranticolor TaxID=155976 RepID=A0A2S6GUD4_9PSEU|nr:glycosyltransferase family 39 protein [Actinokineospora auranticolor]PPK68848.1 4-amino-4-deoxy-L-arabinose transferase-like glycosyltransferase [Actinokineospora auranticolor]
MTALLDAPAPAADQPPATRRRFLRGPLDQPAFVRPAFLGLLVATAVLYFWDLTASGYGNGFYAAAVQAGTQSWKAWLFGSLDAGNVITVDKPPAALWVTTAFARLFGFSSFTVLAPQALMGVGAVALLYATVKRTNGPVAALGAAAALAVTPVAVLMFRFNNPDALLVLLLVAAAYCVVRALEKPKWLLLAGAVIGFAFLTKMMQAFLVLPAFALVFVVAGPGGLGRRLLHLLGALGALVAAAGWYVVLVDLWPADSRPYIGGSTDNSLLELALGYNGLGRVLGGEGNGGGGGGSTGFGGETGIGRMFGASFGGEISWLLPAALIALVGGLWFTRRAPRTDRTRAALLLWGGWLVVTALVFSYMGGTTHPYYAVALAPSIAALVAIGVRELWRGRAAFAPRAVLAGMVAVTAAWDYVLLARDADFLPWLRFLVVAVGLVVATVLVIGVPRARKVVAVVLTAAVLALGLGSAAWAVTTAGAAHTGSIPTSGPTSSAVGGGTGPGGGTRSGSDSTTRMGSGGPGGSASSELTALLAASDAKWAAAVSGSQTAASLELATGKSVIAIGGWSGTDDAPTLAQFKAAVAAGEIDYYLSGGQGGGGRGGSGSASEIAQWVQANYTATTVGGSTVYDLT